MTKEESVFILSTYKQANKKSKIMLEKILVMQNNIYQAQAGYVEHEEGCKVSGGSHKTRAQNISELVDLKDKYTEAYNRNETICNNICEMIENIYTNRCSKPEEELTGREMSNYLLKRQRNENLLIEYYVVDKTIEAIAHDIGYSLSQTKRMLKAAKNMFCELYETENYMDINRRIHEPKKAPCLGTAAPAETAA